MAAYSCNGICHRDPHYSKKRLIGLNFQPFVDAVCRKCEAYFKNFPFKQCPCCKQRVGRHAKKGRALRQRVFTAFADFWRWILKEKKQYDLKHNLRLHKNIGKRSCLICGSSKTYHAGKTKTAMWIKFREGYMCGKCYNRMKYRARTALKKDKVTRFEIQRCN